MSYEHRLGFGCEDVDDRLGDVEAALASAYMSLARIRDWLGRGLANDSPEVDADGALRAMVEDARAEAIEQVGRA